MNNYLFGSAKTIFICSSGRSGSSYFIDLMYNTGDLGYPKEYFGKERQETRQEELGLKNFSDYLTHLQTNALTRNNVFSSKLFPDDLPDIKENLTKYYSPAWNAYTEYQILNSFSSEVYFVWLTRRNKINQALSLYKSFTTNQWRYTERSKEKKQAKAPTFAEIAFYIQYAVAWDALWADFFRENNILPLVLVYEDILLAPQLALESIYKFTGIALPETFTLKTEHRKLGDAKNEEWYRDYFEKFKQLDIQKRASRQRRVEITRFFQKIYYKLKSMKK